MGENEATDQVTPAKRQDVRNWRKYILPLGLFLIILVGLLVGINQLMLKVAIADWVRLARVVIVVIASTLPIMLYLYFIQGRGRILFKEYKQNLRRLGYPDNAQQYQEKFQAVYPLALGDNSATPTDTDATEDPGLVIRPLNSPITIMTLLTLLGWLLVFFPDSANSDTLLPNATPLVYGFLGAYIFGIGSLVRQYVTDDLQPRYYASLTTRYLTVFVLAWLLTLARPQLTPASPVSVTPPVALAPTPAVLPTQSPLATPAAELSAPIIMAANTSGSPSTPEQPASSGTELITAFLIGLFPTLGLRLVQRIGTTALGVFSKGFQEDQPLSLLDGLNAYQEDRLMLEGIENLQNLACANIIDLMLKTRFPVDQIVDWIDQALLQMHTRQRFDHFRGSGLRTATDFLDAYDLADAKSDADRTTRRDQLVNLLDSHIKSDQPAQPTAGAALPAAEQKPLTQALIDSIAVALRSDPNMFHIRYWRNHAYEVLPEDVEQKRIMADLNLMQGLADEAIDLYNDLLRDFPAYYATLLYRGLAYFREEQYDRAVADYTEVINRGGVRWPNTRHAYIQLGRSLRAEGEYEEAAANYRKALDVYGDDFPDARMEMAIVQMTYLSKEDATQYDAALKNLDAVIASNFRVPEALANRGLARYERWKQQGKSAETRLTELELARKDLDRALRLKPDLTEFYINLAFVLRALDQYEVEERTLAKAFAQLETAPAPRIRYQALLERGYHLYFLYHQDYEAAAADFEAAVELFPDEPTAYVFLGELTLAQKNYAAAEEPFRKALQLTEVSGDEIDQARAHLGLGRVYRQDNTRLENARTELFSAVNLAKNRDDEIYIDANYELGLALRDLGDAPRATRLIADSATLYDVLGKKRQSAEAYYQLGLLQADPVKANTTLTTALQQLSDDLQDDDLRQLIGIAQAKLSALKDSSAK